MTEDYGFEIGFYESILIQTPEDERVIELLAQLYTKANRLEDGLQMDLRLSRLRPRDGTVRYNLCCSLALTGKTEEALRALEQALELGYRDIHWMLQDPDLESLHQHPSFRKLIGEA
jgi:predicted Zn-dependent protease